MADLTFDPGSVDLDALLKRLHLANARRMWSDLCNRAESEQWSCRDFLAVLVAEEIAHRQQTRLRRAVHNAHFPFFKTIEDFNFSYQSTVRLQLLGSYLGAEFVTEGRNLILMGKAGRGKTHLAIAIAYRAIQNGATALFTTAAELIDDLSVASREGRLRQSLTRYTHPHVLIVDEVGYLTHAADAANVLFHIVNDRHLRRRPILFTTNKSPLTAWGAVLHDHDLAEAIVDRTLERGRLLVLDGPSVRNPQLDSQTIPVNSRPDKISGKDRTKFREPPITVLDAKDLHIVRHIAVPPAPYEVAMACPGGCLNRVVLPPCSGDCNGDHQITIDELVLGVQMAIEHAPVSSCPGFDYDRNALISVDEVIAAVRGALTGCRDEGEAVRAAVAEM